MGGGSGRKFHTALPPDPAILEDVQSPPRDALTAPFTPADLTWRVVRLAPDKLSAQVRPQLRVVALRARLDAVLGPGGWSHTFSALGERGLACTLSLGGAQKSAAVAYTVHTGVAEAADDALAAAAVFFGLEPSLSLTELPWVDFDAEQGQILYEPDLSAATPAADAPPPAAEEPPAPPAPKPAGQQAIDKLVDRLKAEGKGLQAAKLLNAHGGYGSDPNAARELYARLRDLLLTPSESAE